jgi:hypothetical protein
MTNYKEFLLKGQFELLDQLNEDAKPDWGIMNAQEMVEHVSSLYLITTQKIEVQLLGDEESRQKNYQYFVIGKNTFPHNIKLPGLEKPLPLAFESLSHAIEVLKNSAEEFFNIFEGDPSLKTHHPTFGLLSFEDWQWVHYLHANHHYKQFNLV